MAKKLVLDEKAADNAKNENRLGTRIHDLRHQKNMTLLQLSEEIGCSRSYITRIENGSRHIDSAALLIRIANVLDVPPEELIALSTGNEAVGSIPQPTVSTATTAKQIEVLGELSKIVTTMSLTDEELDQLLTQAIAYAEYCKSKSSR